VLYFMVKLSISINCANTKTTSFTSNSDLIFHTHLDSYFYFA